MKRIANYLIAMAIVAFTFTSCEDVPSPFGEVFKPATDDVVDIEPIGNGTAETPYNVAGVLEYVASLGADVYSTTEVYVKGYVSEVQDVDVSGSYGNATYYISDTEDGSANKFMIYRGFGLGGKKFNEGATPVKQGDAVIIKSKVVNYKGNTPETVANNCIIVQLNNDKAEGGGDEPSGETLGTKDNPLTVSKAVEVISALADGGTTTQDAYVTGKITKIKTAEADIAKYKNIDYIISDGTKELTVFRGKNIDNTDFTEPGQINVGDEVVVIGKLTKFMQSGTAVPEVAQGNYIVKLTKGSGSDTPSGATGTGTANDPFNIAAAIAKCKEVGETASTDKYYIKGFVVKGGTVSGGYGNVTFTMGDTKDATEVFTAYQVAGSDGEKLADGYEVKAGSEVIVYGPILNFKSNTPETAGKSAAQIVTIDGKKTNEGGGGGETGGNDGTMAKPFTPAEANAFIATLPADQNTDKEYYIKGKIVKYANNGEFGTQYGNASFYISENGSESGEQFYVFRTLYLGNVKYSDDSWAKPKVGDEVVICGLLVNYKGNTPETAANKSYIYLLNGKPEAGGGGSQGGGDTSGNSEITVAASSFGLENGTEVGTQTLSDGTTLSFDGGGNSNTPKYYTAGNGTIRMYPQNTMSINAGGKKIASIEIVCNEYNGTLYNASGNVAVSGSGTKTIEGAIVKFTGIDASSVVVTNKAEGSGGATQIRMETLKITYAK